LHADPKHFDKLKPEPGPNPARNPARPDLQLWFRDQVDNSSLS